MKDKLIWTDRKNWLFVRNMKEKHIWEDLEWWQMSVRQGRREWSKNQLKKLLKLETVEFR